MAGSGLRERLIFGTARLAGGGCARASRALLEDCLAAGIGAFDTAPSYGMGAAEALVGAVVGPIAGVRIHTKLGSVRPSVPQLRGWAKRVRMALPGNGPPGGEEPVLFDYRGPGAGCDFGPDAMAASFERSLNLLRRERLELLLLHEAEPVDLPADSAAVLTSAHDTGRAAAIGFAHFGPARSTNAGLTSQVAPWPGDFAEVGGTEPAAERQPRIFHSIRNGGQFAARQDAGWAARRAELAQLIGSVTREGDAEFLAALLSLARRWPAAGLVFATTDRARLAGFFRALAALEQAGLCSAG